MKVQCFSDVDLLSKQHSFVTSKIFISLCLQIFAGVKVSQPNYQEASIARDRQASDFEILIFSLISEKVLLKIIDINKEC